MIGLKGSFFSNVKGHPNLPKSYLKTWNGSERSPSNSTKGFKSVFMFSNWAKKRHDGGEQSRLLESRKGRGDQNKRSSTPIRSNPWKEYATTKGLYASFRLTP